MHAGAANHGQEDSQIVRFLTLKTHRWWAHQDLNLEPTDYESAALTVELWARYLYFELLAVSLRTDREGFFTDVSLTCSVFPISSTRRIASVTSEALTMW